MAYHRKQINVIKDNVKEKKEGFGVDAFIAWETRIKVSQIWRRVAIETRKFVENV